jgi:hypothetical protein
LLEMIGCAQWKQLLQTQCNDASSAGDTTIILQFENALKTTNARKLKDSSLMAAKRGAFIFIEAVQRHLRRPKRGSYSWKRGEWRYMATGTSGPKLLGAVPVLGRTPGPAATLSQRSRPAGGASPGPKRRRPALPPSEAPRANHSGARSPTSPRARQAPAGAGCLVLREPWQAKQASKHLTTPCFSHQFCSRASRLLPRPHSPSGRPSVVLSKQPH